MSTASLILSNVGPMERAEVEFGDLTVLVGPQATGKSIFLQFLKLLVDAGAVLDNLKRHGLRWDRSTGDFLDVYLGEGMCGVWNEGQSQVIFQGNAVDLNRLTARQRRAKRETLFFIPAQRVLTLGKGWPRPFSDYSPGDPFTVRDFSEKVRVLVESGIGSAESLFPQTRRLKEETRRLLLATIFSSFGLCVDKHGAQKRLVLRSQNGESLPFMVWSAGQREFVPLLLGFYWLLPPTKVSRRGDIQWVVIEELEMGLHPRAISVVLLLVLDLISRGYRVCVSTHSPHVLDVVWAIRMFQQHRADPRKLLDLFDVSPTPSMRWMAETMLTKEARVYYFDPTSRRSRDISRLDPGADDASEAGWGGLAEFSGRVADAVAEVVAHAPR
ncbi:MAG: ATP-binding protein [Thermoguttaceae bacterium]|nr:ATP-binding protein [Thermoguttaceae bacterium]